MLCCLYPLSLLHWIFCTHSWIEVLLSSVMQRDVNALLFAITMCTCYMTHTHIALSRRQREAQLLWSWTPLKILWSNQVGRQLVPGLKERKRKIKKTPGAYAAITALIEHFLYWGCEQDRALQACTWTDPPHQFISLNPYLAAAVWKTIGLYHLPIACTTASSLEQFWFTVSGQWMVHEARRGFAGRQEAAQEPGEAHHSQQQSLMWNEVAETVHYGYYHHYLLLSLIGFYVILLIFISCWLRTDILRNSLEEMLDFSSPCSSHPQNGWNRDVTAGVEQLFPAWLKLRHF